MGPKKPTAPHRKNYVQKDNDSIESGIDLRCLGV